MDRAAPDVVPVACENGELCRVRRGKLERMDLDRQARYRVIRNRSGNTLTLSYAPPYDWPAMINFLAARAIAGVELVEPDRYRRTVEVNGRHGTIEVRPMPGHEALAASIDFPGVKELPAIVARIRRMFDLGAEQRKVQPSVGMR
ncbi:MAG TPA: AlkA N-terminal domain-containing protein [Candidatus Binataceae bacterium]|nr:AlkA N-terminal domain-containing protein [Candidatus Binataceae bacterium]